MALQIKFLTPESQNFFKRLAEGRTTGLQNSACEYRSAQITESQRPRPESVEGIQRMLDALERVESLAALGWTLPMGMTPREFHALVMQDDSTVESVDEWFLGFYSRDAGAELSRLKDHMLESDHLFLWKSLIQQVLDAFGQDQFAICVPSLLLVLEGSVAVPWAVAGFHKERCRKDFFEQKVTASSPDSIHCFAWRSLAAFLQKVFEGVDPNQEYPILKRNLILHGKCDPTKWDRADCLRLFQAIDTILSLADELALAEGA